MHKGGHLSKIPVENENGFKKTEPGVSSCYMYMPFLDQKALDQQKKLKQVK